MDTVPATLIIEVRAHCPQCGEWIDLMEGDYNEDAHVIKQACPDGNWSEEHETFSVHDVVCTNCETEFHVAGLDW